MAIMKTLKNNKNNKKIFSLLAAILVLALAALLFVAYQMQSDDMEAPSEGIDKINFEKSTKSQNEDGDKAKEAAINKTDNSLTPPNSEADPSPLSITGAEFNPRENGLVINTRITNVASWSRCLLEVTKGDTVIKEDVRVVYQDDASFCGGFFIPKEKLESGVWSIALTALEIGGRAYEVKSSVTIP